MATFTANQVQGVFGEFISVFDNAAGGFTSNNTQGIFGEFTFVLDEARGTGDNDTYFIISASNPDTLDLYVEGVLTARFVGGQLLLDQVSSSGAKPVLKLDQGDIDDSFVDFIGTSAADGSRSISSDTTEDSAKFGAFRIEINGVTKWIRIYDNES